MAISLSFEKRDITICPNSLRRVGKIPAVFYGSKQASTPIAIFLRDFEKVWKQAGEHTVINLQGGGEEIQALLHAVDKHPVTDIPRHADFYVFEKEPKFAKGLTKLPNVVLTPHIASATKEARFDMARMAAENIIAALAGKTPPNAVQI